MDRRVFLFLLAASYIWGVEAMHQGSMKGDLSVLEATDYYMVFVYNVKGNRPDPVNRLDTERGTFTKDMVSDPSITFELALTHEQMTEITERMVEIGFFSYPSLYIHPTGLSSPPSRPTPHTISRFTGTESW